MRLRKFTPFQSFSSLVNCQLIFAKVFVGCSQRAISHIETQKSVPDHVLATLGGGLLENWQLLYVPFDSSQARVKVLINEQILIFLLFLRDRPSIVPTLPAFVIDNICHDLRQSELRLVRVIVFVLLRNLVQVTRRACIAILFDRHIFLVCLNGERWPFRADGRLDWLLICFGVICSCIVERLVFSHAIVKARLFSLIIEQIVKILVVWYLSCHIVSQAIKQTLNFLGRFIILCHGAHHRVVIRHLEFAFTLGKFVLSREMLA